MKPVTAELGCVTPYIAVPGRWSQKDLDYYADEVVASLVNNAGHNCLKVEVVVTDADWELRDQFVDAIRLVFLQQAHPCLLIRSSAYTFRFALIPVSVFSLGYCNLRPNLLPLPVQLVVLHSFLPLPPFLRLAF